MTENTTMRISRSLIDRYKKIEFADSPKSPFTIFAEFILEKEIEKLENQSTSKRPKK